MRRPIVAGNWKMHGSRAENARLIEEIAAGFPERPAAACIVCPPFVYLQEVGRLLRDAELDSQIELGAQDCCAEAQGAYTGEVSAAMLRDVGCTYVIVGHSERRTLYGEDDQLVARKFAAAQSKGLVPILCVGEQLSEREAGLTNQVVGRQLDAVLELCGADAFAGAVIAYEPVWAIGTGRNALPDDAGLMAEIIRDKIREAHGSDVADRVRILYGGSVNPGNIKDFMAKKHIDGALVGGASLDPDQFAAIVRYWR